MNLRWMMSTTVTMILLTAMAFGQQGAQNAPGPTGGAMGERLMQELKLTDQQRKEIGDLRLEMAKQSIAQQAKIKTARLELAELFRADSPDKSAIEKKVDEISQLQTQMRHARIDHWFAVNRLLSADQQKIWKRMLGQMWMQHRMNGMQSFGRGAQMRQRSGMGRMMQRDPRSQAPMPEGR
jgi:Spy/CpxP family protein refolding chaperone